MTTIAELGVVVNARGVQQSARDLDQFNASAGRADRAASGLATTAKRALAAVAATGAAYVGTRALFDAARSYENLSAKMRLYMASQAELIRAQGQLFNIAQRAGVELGGVTDLYVKLSGASEDLRNNQAKLLRTVELFSKGLAVSGADAAAAASSTRQFAQALASGTLRGDEFVSVMEGAPRVAKALADGLGVPIGKLRELAAEGKLTAETVTGALLRGGQAIDAEFNRMPLTVDRAMQKVKNSFLQLIGQTNQATGATRGLSASIDALANAMGNPSTIAAFQSTAGWLARIAANALNAAGALREYFAANDQKGLASLVNRRTDLESELFALQRRGGLVADANDPIAKLLGLPANTAAKIAEKKAELAEIESLITKRRRLGDWVEGRVVSKPGTGRWANVTSDPVAVGPAVLDTGTGEVKAKALRSIGRAASDAAQSMRDYVAEEAALERASLANVDAQTQAQVAFERIRAELAGPLALAQFDHIQAMQEIERLGNAAGVPASAIVAAQDAQRAAYEETTEAILEQQRVMASPETMAIMDGFRRGAVDTLSDIVTGAASAKDAMRSFFDGLAEQVTRMIAQRWIDQLFGAPGTSGAGTGGGNLIGSILGMFGFGGFASGGYTGPGGVNKPAGIVHAGEVVWSQADIARAGGVGNVEAMRRGGRSGTTIVQHISVPQGNSYDNASNVGQRALMGAQRALARNR